MLKETDVQFRSQSEETSCDAWDSQICNYKDITDTAKKFKALITPLTAVRTPFSNNAPEVEFLLLVEKRTIFLQWEPFNGTVAQSSTNLQLVVQQTFSYLPPYNMEFPICINLKGTPQTACLKISIAESTPLSFSLEGFNVVTGDTIDIAGAHTYSVHRPSGVTA